MKVISIIILILLSSINYSFSQNHPKYDKIKNKYNVEEGFILTKDSIKQSGLLRLYPGNETKKVQFIDKNLQKKMCFPSSILEYGYKHIKYKSNDKFFFELVFLGKKVSLYKQSYITPTNLSYESGNQLDDFYLNINGTTKFTSITKENFIYDVLQYFEDCQAVKSDLISKKLKYRDLEKIVKNYNQCH